MAMKRQILIRLLVALVPVGSAGCEGAAGSNPNALPIDEETSGKADGTTWRKVLDCDNGAAVLDVDDGQRQILQFVIRDRSIVDYLAGTLNGFVYRSDLVNGKNEIIVKGRVQDGVFQPEDFGGFDTTRIGTLDGANLYGS